MTNIIPYIGLEKSYPFQSFIYVIKNEITGNVKIGISTDPYSRANTFQIGCDCELTLLCFYPGSMEQEWELHALFQKYRIHGEWFHFVGEVEEYFQSFIDKYPANARPTISGLDKFSIRVFDYIRSVNYSGIKKRDLMENSHQYLDMGKARLKTCLATLELKNLIIVQESNRQQIIKSNDGGVA